MNENKITTNAGLSVLQVGLSAVFLFVIYRYLLLTLGIEQLGIWSLIMALTSVSQVGGFGLGGAVIKFMAKYLARNRPDKAARMIETAFLSLALLIGALALLLYLPLLWSLPLFLPAKVLPVAAALLPLSLLSFWLMALGGVYLSGLYGCQRIDLRALVMISGLGLNLGCIFALVPRFGLLGVAYAQMIQAAFLLLVGAVLLRRQLSALSRVPHHWDRNLFREMLGYGINFQIISLVLMLFDPLTKALLSHFGGLTAVGYFELANRMVIQVRSLIISANQVIVPVVAQQHEVAKPLQISLDSSPPQKTAKTERTGNIRLYDQNIRWLMFIALPLFAGLAAVVPSVSLLWIGHYQSVFALFSLIAISAWFLNTLSGPAYFMYMGIGDLRANMWAHIMMGAFNLVLGPVLGYWFGGLGVVSAWALALILGSFMLMGVFHTTYSVSLQTLLSSENLRLFVVSTGAVLVCWKLAFVLMQQGRSAWLILALSAGLFGLILIWPLWLHSMRQQIYQTIRRQK